MVFCVVHTAIEPFRHVFTSCSHGCGPDRPRRIQLVRWGMRGMSPVLMWLPMGLAEYPGKAAKICHAVANCGHWLQNNGLYPQWVRPRPRVSTIQRSNQGQHETFSIPDDISRDRRPGGFFNTVHPRILVLLISYSQPHSQPSARDPSNPH